MLQCPFNKTLFLQILYRYTWISIIRSITINQYTHTFQQMHAIFKTEMQHTLFIKCNLPFEQCSVFLQGQYPYKIWSVSAKDMPFEGAQYAFPHAKPSSQRSNIPFLHQYSCTRCNIIDTGHPSQKCHIFENMRFFRNVFCSLQQRIVLYL